jgi:hypothetical protein
VNVNLTFTMLASSILNGNQDYVADALIDYSTSPVTRRGPQSPLI